jgi:hypothetical protein
MNSIETDVSLALALAGDDPIPCITSECEENAAWVIYLGHVDQTDCPERPAVPQCHQHKTRAIKALRLAGKWPGLDPIDCTRCEQMLDLDHTDPIGT